MRRLALILLTAISCASAAKAETAPSFIPLFGPDSSYAKLIPLNEAAADSLLRNSPLGLYILAERDSVREQARNAFEQEVMIVTLLVENNTKSTYPLPVSNAMHFTIGCRGEKIPALAVYPAIVVQPGNFAATFVIFPILALCPEGLFNLENLDKP